MDLGKCTIRLKVSPCLSKIAKSFPFQNDKIQKSLQSWQDVSFDIPYFTTENVRTLLQGDKEKLKTFIAKVENWGNSIFGKAVLPEIMSKLARHATNYVLWTFPSNWEIGGEAFFLFTKSMVFGLIWDECMDSTSSIFQPGVEVDISKLNQSMAMALRFVDLYGETGISDKDDFVNDAISKIRTNSKNPLLQGFMDCLFDHRRHKEELGWTDSMTSVLTPTMMGAHWLHTHNLETQQNSQLAMIMEPTYRFFRNTDSGHPMVLYGVYSFETGSDFKAELLNSLVTRFVDLGSSIVAGLNDVLGFQKDLVKGECLGGVFYQMRHFGVSANEALAHEVELLKGNIQQYLVVRRQMLENNREYGSMVEISDNGLYNQLFTFTNSPWYGVNGGSLEVIQKSS